MSKEEDSIHTSIFKTPFKFVLSNSLTTNDQYVFLLLCTSISQKLLWYMSINRLSEQLVITHNVNYQNRD